MKGNPKPGGPLKSEPAWLSTKVFARAGFFLAEHTLSPTPFAG